MAQASSEDVAAAGCGVLLDSFLGAEVSVDPHHLSFESVPGFDPPPFQSIRARCFYLDSYGEGCGASVETDQPWLKVDEEDFYGVETIHVSVDPEGLPPGTYQGTIHIEYFFYSIDDEEDVEVELAVK